MIPNVADFLCFGRVRELFPQSVIESEIALDEDIWTFQRPLQTTKFGETLVGYLKDWERLCD